MKKPSQESRIIKKLLHDGYVTRNQALANYISRLGAIICNLQKQGWEFDADYIKTPNGLDYKYVVTKSPFRKVIYTVADGRQIISNQKVK